MVMGARLNGDAPAVFDFSAAVFFGFLASRLDRFCPLAMVGSVRLRHQYVTESTLPQPHARTIAPVIAHASHEVARGRDRWDRF